MDVEQKQAAVAPFQEECNTEKFFVGGGRGAILNDIKTALQEGVDLVTLIGEEGSGKTMLCKILQEQWGENNRVLFLPQIVESFEDVVRVAAQECNLQYPADINRADARKIFLDLIATLRAKRESLLLICDEAEKMYLATLERIRKILDDVNAEGGGLQLLFSGRKSLSGNMEQLALCDFNGIIEKQFFLSALDDNETWSYLNFCVQGLRGVENQEVFTKEAAAKIASMGRGNLRLINMYADESLRSSNADTSFLVLLDHVKGDTPSSEFITPPADIWSRFPFPPKYLIGGGAAFIAVMLVIFLKGGDEPVPIETAVNETGNPVFTTMPVFPERDFADDPVETVQVPEEDVQEAPDELVAPRDIAGVREQDAVEAPVAVNGDDALQDMEQVKTEPVPPEISRGSVQRTPVDISPVEIVERSTPDTGISGPQSYKKITADKSKRRATTRLVNNQKKKFPGRSSVSATSVESAAPESPQDPVLEPFFAAGQKWLAGEYDSSFSIQLMALKSEKAEENLKRILTQPEYQAVVDKLVMLKKPSDPPVFMIFYGVYPSMAAARNARNNMPIFLRDRHPYPVSVRGAVEKSRVE